MRLREIGGRGTFTFFLLSLNGEYVFHTSPFQIGMKILLRPPRSHMKHFATTCGVPSITVAMVRGDSLHLPFPQHDRDKKNIRDDATTTKCLAMILEYAICFVRQYAPVESFYCIGGW